MDTEVNSILKLLGDSGFAGLIVVIMYFTMRHIKDLIKDFNEALQKKDSIITQNNEKVANAIDKLTEAFREQGHELKRLSDKVDGFEK